ncbi:hypothetical protein [Sedimentibacter sp. B4]|uniref:hypothetical protein n=1 Tax=Sedimentibacter sp. B4 TaxID=304766 RepID=UPI0002EAEB2B|nr:hypothetical protein [Sedimentibacter sp. B4]
MKKTVILFTLCLSLFIMAGCDKSVDNDSQAVAEKFFMEMYTVDKEEVEKYNNFLDLRPADEKEFAEAIEANDEVIKSLMTNRAYNVLLKNRQNFMFTQHCALNNCTIQVMDVDLSGKESGAEENKADYNFEVKIQFISNDGSVLQDDSAKGQLRLEREDNEWKISDYRVFEYPKTIVN